MTDEKKWNITTKKIKDAETLLQVDLKYRSGKDITEFIPYANGVSYMDIARDIVTDKKGSWATPLYFTASKHSITHGMTKICIEASEYIREMTEKENIDLDVLSISACIIKGHIFLYILVRDYSGPFDFGGFFNRIGDPIMEIETEAAGPATGKLIIPEEIKNFQYTEEEIIAHKEEYEKQCRIFESSTKEHPLLNTIEKYTPKRLPMPEDTIDMIYDLRTKDQELKTVLPYEKFNRIFQDVLTYVNGVEYYRYVAVMQGDEKEEKFMAYLESYVETTYVNPGILPKEDVDAMMSKLYRALFQFYVVQDLIDDPMVTDIKITAPDSIRARVKGKAYMSNINFIDTKDFCRFVNGIAIRNRIDQNVPEQTFTDQRDDNYALRLSITAEYVNSPGWPYLHIRKINRKKLMAPDLIAAGMFDEKIRDYLLDCGKNSRGVVFAGPPGSGKTVALNWFLEDAYEQSAEILVIQENDELFCYRKGVMFQHVVNYPKDDQQMPVSLEALGQLALVAGANVFVIGEAKGAEICSAITLSNSGCRTAITIHSPSSTETIDKMADLAMRGYARDIDQAKKMLRSFQTIVYMQDFKVQEISEIVGYDDAKHEMIYKYIYRREAE